MSGDQTTLPNYLGKENCRTYRRISAIEDQNFSPLSLKNLDLCTIPTSWITLGGKLLQQGGDDNTFVNRNYVESFAQELLEKESKWLDYGRIVRSEDD